MKSSLTHTLFRLRLYRRGAVPVAALLVVVAASVLAGALVAYFIFSRAARGLEHAILSVVGQPVLYATGSGVELLVALKNAGTASVDLAGSVVVLQAKDAAVELTFAGSTVNNPGCNVESCKLAPGDSVAVRYFATGAELESFLEGSATLQTRDGCQVNFNVAKP